MNRNASTRTVRVVIVIAEDHTLMAQGLRKLLEREFESVAIVGNGSCSAALRPSEALANLTCYFSRIDTSAPRTNHALFSEPRPSTLPETPLMCQIITGDPKATLGQAVKKLEDSGVKLHPAFEGALQKMYGYTNDAEGTRHALLEESTLDADDARFMLVSCSAFVNYLKAKSSKSGG